MNQMKKIIMGSNNDKFVFWQKVCTWFNIIVLLGIVLSNYYKKDLQAYRTLITALDLMLILIWAVALTMFFIFKRKIKTN